MKISTFVIAALSAAGMLWAQGPGPGPGPLQPDPPSRVARLNWMNGNVSFQPAGVDTWAGATLNYPLTTGDHIYTDNGARAEMHIGPNALRLNGASNFGFLNLDDRTVQIRFTSGALEVRIRRLDDDDLYEVDTPQGAISLLRAGDYRIDTDPDRNATMVTVRGGEAEVTANGGSGFSVHPRQTAYFADSAPPDVRSLNPPDDFDRFTADLNAREDRIPPPVHVPPGMGGYQDLDANGVWREAPGYGWVWAPRVAAGWAPYHYGHWAFIEPWGWTWIDDAPWGFAPFHYGRWAYLGGGWVWAPGAVVARPVYAPALVAFVGGPHFGLAIGIGGGIGGGVGAVAWFPLGPREPYYPAYHVSNTYIQQVNITHVTNVNVTNVNVTNVRYANQQVPGAVTAVPQNAFVGARPVAAAAQRVTPEQMAQAQVVGAAPQVAPQRASVMGGGIVSAAVAHPAQSLANRQVVTKSTPPPAPVSFQAKQQMLSQNQGRPLAPEQTQQLRAQQQPAAGAGNRPAAAAPPVNRLDSRPPAAAAAQPAARPQAERPAAAERQAPASTEKSAPAERPAPQKKQPPKKEAPKREREER